MFMDPFWLRKLTTDPHIFALANIKCPDVRYGKLKICISKLFLYRCEYIIPGCW